MSTARAERQRGASVPRSPVALTTLALLALWIVLPFLQSGIDAQDAVPFLTAGELVTDHPEAAYPRPEGTSAWSLDPRFLAEACPDLPDPARCDVLPFLSPPVALVPAWLAGRLGTATGVLVYRLVGCLAAASGMWLLVRRFDGRAAPALLATTVLLTPMVYVSSAVGQTSALMFTSVAIGIAGSTRTRPAAVAALVWSATITFKLFPLALVPVALVARRWRLLAWTLAVLILLATVALLIAPAQVWSAFVSSTRAVTATTVGTDTNLSIDALAHRLAPAWNGTQTGFVPLLVARIALLASVFAWRMRRADPDVQWAWGWAAVLLVQPQVWWHYGILVVGALGVGVASRTRRRPHEEWLVAAGAAATLLLTFLTDQLVLLVVSNGFVIAVLVYLTVACAQPADRPTPTDVVDRSR